MNATLHQFWKVMEACGIDTETALDMLKEIEEKRERVRVYDLPEINDKDYIALSDDDIVFIAFLKHNKLTKQFARVTGFSDRILRRITRKGYATVYTYEKLQMAKRKWEGWVSSQREKKRRIK